MKGTRIRSVYEKNTCKVLGLYTYAIDHVPVCREQQVREWLYKSGRYKEDELVIMTEVWHNVFHDWSIQPDIKSGTGIYLLTLQGLPNFNRMFKTRQEAEDYIKKEERDLKQYARICDPPALITIDYFILDAPPRLKSGALTKCALKK